MRILTYNIHRCEGTDRKVDVGRVAAVIAAERPDIVALQEVDVGRRRTGGVDQAHDLARRLGMTSRFHPAMSVELELYGEAILTALPERLIKAGALPGYARVPGLEPRGALWIAIDVGAGRELQVITTHLGLAPPEQRLQAKALTGEGWLASVPGQGAAILLGDFNAIPGSEVYRTLSTRLSDARRAVAGRKGSLATFPSPSPMLSLDHVFISAGVKVRRLAVARSPLARLASDHLPLVMDFDLEA
jgi:endonuclease/exonuclease/phosphatase family metal-dependent hydrolase